MNDIFKLFIPSVTDVSSVSILFKMVISTALGAFIAFHISTIHRTMHNYERLKLAKAQIILCLVGTIMVIVIGDNVARAFGLFGLGSFIRFRTAIKDAMDTAVIFLLIGIGMAIGVDLYSHAVIVFVFLYLLIFFMSFIKTHQEKVEDIEIKKIRQKQKSQFLEKSGEEVSSEISEETAQDDLDIKTAKKKECPQCAEKVKIKANVCRYCGYEFDDDDED